MTAELFAQLSESYLLSAGLWSLGGFVGGYLAGRLHHRWIEKGRHDR